MMQQLRQAVVKLPRMWVVHASGCDHARHARQRQPQCDYIGNRSMVTTAALRLNQVPNESREIYLPPGN